jgi:hypothetical protein
MDPEDLKKRFEERSSKNTIEAAEAKAETDTQATEQQKRIEVGRAAIRDIVIPYFREIEATFPKGQFSFDTAAKVDPKELFPIAVSFTVGSGPRYFIEVIRGNVRVFCEGPYFEPPKNGNKASIKYAQFIFGSSEEPFIEGPNDLSREKIGKLIQIAIDQC